MLIFLVMLGYCRFSYLGCSVRVKKLIKVGLSEGGCVQLLGGGAYHESCCENNVLLACVSQHLFVSSLKVLVGVGTKEKPFMRTENSSSVYVRSMRLCCMFLLYWEVYISMDLVVNLPNEDLYWFCGKKTFIDGGVYVRCSMGVGSRVTSSNFR